MNRFLAQLLEGVGEGAGVDITDKGIFKLVFSIFRKGKITEVSTCPLKIIVIPKHRRT